MFRCYSYIFLTESFYKSFLIKTNMINENILSMFKSHINNPSFSIVITEIEQNEECGHDNLAITVHQIDKPLNLWYISIQ